MADCTKQFKKFFENIELTDSQVETLKTNREGLRNTIRKYFSDNALQQPDFCWQGSFSMGTTIKDPDNEYDFDDGVYLNNLPEDKDKWPKTEFVHEYIFNAVKNQSAAGAIDKKKCVRVPYSDNHHVDLAIYGKAKDTYFLAVKGDTQWEENNAKLFKEWFDIKKKDYGDDFVKAIRAIKKWAKVQGYSQFSGFYITILIGNNFSPNQRFDLCMKETLENILNDLRLNYKIVRPVKPMKNLTEEKYQTNAEFNEVFIKPLESFLEIVKSSVNSTSLEEATTYWSGLFGVDYPVVEAEEKSTRLDSAFAISTTPQPWSL